MAVSRLRLGCRKMAGEKWGTEIGFEHFSPYIFRQLRSNHRLVHMQELDIVLVFRPSTYLPRSSWYRISLNSQFRYRGAVIDHIARTTAGVQVLRF